MQSFTLWQKATIEIPRRAHLFLLVCDTYIWALFFTYITFVANRTFHTRERERERVYWRKH